MRSPQVGLLLLLTMVGVHRRADVSSIIDRVELFYPRINETNLTVRPMCTFIHDVRHDARGAIDRVDQPR